MQQKIKWGIIGLGSIAQKFASDLQLSKNAILYAVASRSYDKAVKFGKKYNAIKCYNSYLSLANDPQIDVVYIATPHVFHFENTMLCLKHKKGVLCEKPMGMNLKEVEIMTHEAKKNNLFLMEGLWTRFIPIFETFIELIKNGEIGEIKSLHADFGFKSSPNEKNRLFDKLLGGGSLLDIGIYPIYFSLITLGIPKKIEATASINKNGIDENCTIRFSYKYGQQAYLASSIIKDLPTEAKVNGDYGDIKLFTQFHNPQKMTVSKKNETSKTFEKKYIGFGYFHEIEEVNQCISLKKTESEKLPLSLSLNLMAQIDEVKKQIDLTY